MSAIAEGAAVAEIAWWKGRTWGDEGAGVWAEAKANRGAGQLVGLLGRLYDVR